ncbi:MAG: molybdenum cofactor guanylyltransferase, partial [Candidatus Limnocylindrales bacterium]
PPRDPAAYAGRPCPRSAGGPARGRGPEPVRRRRAGGRSLSRTSAGGSPADRPAASGIVLAGGRSSRFGGDKLSTRVRGGTLLDAAIAGVRAVATDVVVVLAPGDQRSVGAGIRTVADPESFGGPLVGLLAGLEVVDQPLVIVAGGDMPDLDPEVLGLMVRTLAGGGEAVGAVILQQRGRGVPLPAVVRTGSATDVARRLVADGERSLRGLFDRLPTRILDEGAWRPLDPEAATLRDVDEAADLDP